MKLTPYRKALKCGKKAMDQLLVPVKVNKAKKQAELEMCSLEEQIATTEVSLHDLCSKESVDFPRIIELQDSMALLNRKKKQYTIILEQMFPEEEV
jgi:hypothetical protein